MQPGMEWQYAASNTINNLEHGNHPPSREPKGGKLRFAEEKRNHPNATKTEMTASAADIPAAHSDFNTRASELPVAEADAESVEFADAEAEAESPGASVVVVSSAGSVVLVSSPGSLV